MKRGIILQHTEISFLIQDWQDANFAQAPELSLHMMKTCDLKIGLCFQLLRNETKV